MQLGQRQLQAIGLAMCVIAFVVAAVVPWTGSAAPMHALKGTSAVVDLGTENGGSIAATVSWPAGAAARADICVVVFDENGSVADERHHDEINRIIYEELVHGKIVDDSRKYVVSLIDELWDAGAGGVILGCSELELLVKQADSDLPAFPCTTLHVEAALDRALG